MDSELQHVTFFAAVLVVRINSHRQQSPKDIAVHLKGSKYCFFFKIDDTRGWNDTNILSFAPAKDCDAEEMEETLVATLNQLAKTISRNVVIGGVGAYAVNDDVDQYYLVK